MASEYAERIVAEESAKQSLIPVIIELESILDRADGVSGVDWAEIDPDTGYIYAETHNNVSFVVKVEPVL